MRRRKNNEKKVSSIKSLYTFFKNVVIDPYSMGMIFPSSPFLAKALAHQINENVIKALQEQVASEREENIPCSQGYVVEFGAGIGTVTKQILRRGVPLSRLIVVESSLEMVLLLKKRFKGLNIVHDDAANIEKYLPQHAYIACIVSSLPFLSLPKPVSDKIIARIKEKLGEATLIQYTYSHRRRTFLEEMGFIKNRKKAVILNIPPAYVIDYSYPIQ